MAMPAIFLDFLSVQSQEETPQIGFSVICGISHEELALASQGTFWALPPSPSTGRNGPRRL
jgi:hypothetical protein